MLIMGKLNNLPTVRTTSIKLWRKNLNLDCLIPIRLSHSVYAVCVYAGGSGSYIKLIGEKHISFHCKWTSLKGKGKHPWVAGNKKHSRSYLSISSASEQGASSSTVWVLSSFLDFVSSLLCFFVSWSSDSDSLTVAFRISSNTTPSKMISPK